MSAATTWKPGDRVDLLTRAEAAAMADHLSERGAAVWRDPKHPDNAALSATLVELRKHAHPGYIDGNGAVAGDLLAAELPLFHVTGGQ